MDGTKTCPYCGKLAATDAQFCQGCGRSISSPQQGGYERPPQSYQQQPQQEGWGSHPQQEYQFPPLNGSPTVDPSVQSPNGQFYGGIRGQISAAIQNRSISDTILGQKWFLWPSASIAIAIVTVIILSIANNSSINIITISIYIIPIAIISILLFSILNYKLLTIMNEHKKREMALRIALITYLKQAGTETQKHSLIVNDITALESINQESIYKEEERIPSLWAIISAIPFLNLAVLYLLGEFPFDHDKRWHAFTQHTQAAFQKLGMNVMTPSWSTIHERNNVLLLVAASVMIPFFGLGLLVILIWYQIIIKDFNEHIKVQWQFEDQIIAQLR